MKKSFKTYTVWNFGLGRRFCLLGREEREGPALVHRSHRFLCLWTLGQVDHVLAGFGASWVQFDWFDLGIQRVYEWLQTICLWERRNSGNLEKRVTATYYTSNAHLIASGVCKPHHFLAAQIQQFSMGSCIGLYKCQLLTPHLYDVMSQ